MSYVGSCYKLLLLLVFSWPPGSEVCPNDEVVLFQPRTGTPTELGSIASFYIAILLNPLLHYPPATRFPIWGVYPLMPCLSLPFPTSCLHKGSFVRLGVTCLRPSIPRPIAPCIRIRFSYFPASPALATPAIFITLLPFCRLNLF